MRRSSCISTIGKQAIVGLLTLTLFPAIFGPQSIAEPDIQMIHDAIFKATVRVEAHGFAASGFMYGGNDRQLVTNLHAVLPRQGSEETSIKVQCGANTDTAKVVRVLREADLVLLETENLSLTDMGCQPIGGLSVAKPKPKEKLDVFGYMPGNARAPFQKETVKQSMGGDETLERIVDKNLLSTVRELGMPDPKLPLYHVGTGLYPGFSGGPVINGYGELIGVVDGGLDNGLKSHAWVIPAINIQKLLDSPPTSALPSILLKPEYGFGFSGEILAASENKPVVMQSGAEQPYEFVYIKTRTLEEIYWTADPAEGLRELVDDLLPEVETNAEAELAFDIYQEFDLGLIVAVPQGRALVYDQAVGVLALEGGGDGNTQFAIAHDSNPDYAGGLGSHAHDVLQKMAKNDSQSACNSEDDSQYECELSDVRSFDYGDAGLMVRYGYTVVNQRKGEADYYYNSLVNRGADLFFVSAQIGFEPETAVARCYEQKTEAACGESFWNAAALLIATQLTTVDGLLSPTENASVQTLVADTGGQDQTYSNSYTMSEQGGELASIDASTAAARVSFYTSDGAEAFAYTGGVDWWINIGGNLEYAIERDRTFYEDRSATATLEYGTSQYLVPLAGGSAFSAAAGQQWSPFRQVYQPDATYLHPNGQLAFLYKGGGDWFINVGGQLQYARETERSTYDDGSESATLEYGTSQYLVPLSGGSALSAAAGQQWSPFGEVYLPRPAAN